MNERLEKRKILIIGLVWPESKSSAAGKRILQLLACFKSWGMELYFGSTAKKSEYSDDLRPYGVKEVALWLNDSRTDAFLASLQPDMVLYDRFMVEEQFGWRVTEQCPNAMTILDTEDLHFLRYARQEMQKSGGDMDEFIYSERTKRELASIMRCDLSLLISLYEYELLRDVFNIRTSKLCYLPFLEEPLAQKDMECWKRFDEREGFVFIGNFIHQPNWQTVLCLKSEIWPLLRKRLPKVKMHIYGAYPSQKVLQLNNEREGFLVHGRAEDALVVVGNARVMLAPIPFGAGIKGKFVDAMRVGTPSVSSSIGVESMKGDFEWCGFVADQVEDFVNKAVDLYTDEVLWKEKQQNAILLYEQYASDKHISDFYEITRSIFHSISLHRQRNFLGEVFKHHSVQSSKYMGLWIEEKNKKN